MSRDLLSTGPQLLLFAVCRLLFAVFFPLPLVPVVRGIILSSGWYGVRQFGKRRSGDTRRGTHRTQHIAGLKYDFSRIAKSYRTVCERVPYR